MRSNDYRKKRKRIDYVMGSMIRIYIINAVMEALKILFKVEEIKERSENWWKTDD